MVLLEALINYSEVLQKKAGAYVKNMEVWLEKIDVFATVCYPQKIISKKTLIDY